MAPGANRGKGGRGGVMKRPEYREAGKVGSCENCSAWKDVGTRPGGLGGAWVSESVGAEVPPFQLRVDHELPCFLQRRWGALRRNQRHGHTRPPNPPAHGDRRPKRYHSAHSDLEIFNAPVPLLCRSLYMHAARGNMGRCGVFKCAQVGQLTAIRLICRPFSSNLRHRNLVSVRPSS